MNSTKKPIAVILDAMSTARHYADVFRKHGIECAHIQSSGQMHPRFYREFVEANFLTNMLADNNQELEELSRNFQVLCVLPGQDPVAPLADELSKILNAKYANASATSGNRVDKYQMIKAISEYGLSTPSCLKISDMSELDSFLKTQQRFPIVAKPPRSAGVDLVEICHTRETLSAAINGILSTKNVYGAKNDYAVIQSFVEGQEYMVDTVTAQGCNHLISVWKMTRASSKTPYPLFAETIDLQSTEARIAFDYVSKVLSATGHNFGPAHCEIKIEEQIPTIIEINPRLHGSLDVHAIEEATGSSQISCLARILKNEPPLAHFGEKKIVLKAYFLSPFDVKLRTDVDVRPFHQIPGFYSIDTNFTAGRDLKKTTTLTTAAGYIYFKSATHEEVQRSYAEFRKIEAEMWREIEHKQLSEITNTKKVLQ